MRGYVILVLNCMKEIYTYTDLFATAQYTPEPAAQEGRKEQDVTTDARTRTLHINNRSGVRMRSDTVRIRVQVVMAPVRKINIIII